ncbi:hypothetical protein EYE40_11025 [Glaciihabitans arcticus]|uniref:SRPBCC family protein n=1 Tax=Glaciihabitans arcticus TaxID=2668039 RepID=A0A4Q9GT54_9MICO|nr:hypothetical protein [Glaciihabitans arcticus]TBN57881.1 hypothetical protein EYE40_11025 [Glaciihabitans arcticus]
MRIVLKLVLDCEPDAAWRAIRNPRVFRAVSSPLTTFVSLEPQGFPETWPEGVHHLFGRAFGVLPMGEQTIDLAFLRRGKVRMVRDSGEGLSGPLALVTAWEHTMAVADSGDGRTLYRDQLRFSAGAITPLLWPVFWAFWQWRAFRMSQLAPTWR